MPKTIVIPIGTVFSRLTVIGPRIKGKNAALYLCRCECGKEKLVRYQKLVESKTQSCGCYGRERASEVAKNWTRSHGMAYSREWNCWCQMIRRCEDPASPSYDRYKDVEIAEEFRDFEKFYAHIGPAPSNRHTIDRLKNELGYIPGNVKWSTAKEQANNRSSNVVIEFNGVSMTCTQWANKMGYRRDLISRRIRKGWSVRDAIMLPPDYRNRT